MDGQAQGPRHYRDTSRRPKGLAGEEWMGRPKGRVTIGIPRVDQRASLEKSGRAGLRGRVTKIQSISTGCMSVFRTERNRRVGLLERLANTYLG